MTIRMIDYYVKNLPFDARQEIFYALERVNVLEVEKMLEKFLQEKNCFYFGGHRPVIGVKYNLRANGKFIQIHNPDEMNVAIIQPNKIFNPNEDIKSIV